MSAAPNPAREPVSGWIQPIVMALVLPDPDPDPDRALDAGAARLEQAAGADRDRARAERLEQVAAPDPCRGGGTPGGGAGCGGIR